MCSNQAICWLIWIHLYTNGMAAATKNVKVECMHSLVITWTMRQCYTSFWYDGFSLLRGINISYILPWNLQNIFVNNHHATKFFFSVFWVIYRSNRLNVIRKWGLIYLMPLLNIQIIKHIMRNWVVFREKKWDLTRIIQHFINFPLNRRPN